MDEQFLVQSASFQNQTENCQQSCPIPDLSLSSKHRAALNFSSANYQMSFCSSHRFYAWHMRERDRLLLQI